MHGLIYITTSDGRSLPYGRLEDLLSRSPSPLNCHTSDNSKAWVVMDFGKIIDKNTLATADEFHERSACFCCILDSFRSEVL